MDLFDYIYNIFYIEIFNALEKPTVYFYHEISLFLTFVTILLFIIGIFKFIRFFGKLFGLVR